MAKKLSTSAELERKQYDIIFMDVWMPFLSGREATIEIRNNVQGDTRGEPFVVATTACVMPGDREKCIASGMNQCLSKLIRKEELCAMLEKWLDERAKTENQLKIQSQQKLIQRKKREMMPKRTLASLLVSMTDFAEESIEAGSTGVDPDDDGDDEEDDNGEGREGDENGDQDGTLDAESGTMCLNGNVSIDTQQRRRRRHHGAMVLSDTEEIVRYYNGGGGGLNLMSVGAEE